MPLPIWNLYTKKFLMEILVQMDFCNQVGYYQDGKIPCTIKDHHKHSRK